MAPPFANAAAAAVRRLPAASATAAGAAAGENVLEVYLDFVCPFSRRIFVRLVDEVLPYAATAHPGKLALVFRHQVQPWHPQSTLLHEAAIAGARLAPTRFYAVARVLFDVSEDFYDAATYGKSRAVLYEELAAVVERATAGEAPRGEVLRLLAYNGVDGAKNGGNAVTDELKVHIRIARQNAIHVSPTVAWNGLIDNNVSSGWDIEKWKEYLAERIA
ncbi:hypothetical protein HK405_013645 [Cladochytrium tenue]|nr:hypothetical protein HK405_013645 [Cladochytrium tenue]